MNQLLAQATEYKLLTPLPIGQGGTEVETVTFASYIPGLFNLIIGIAGVLAVVMIIYGGIQYMSTDAFQGKSDAKNTIQNAIWGLILTISAWLILYTVNPNLVEFNLNIERQEINNNSNEEENGPEGGGLTQQQALATFEAANITIAGPINLAGIRLGITDEIIRLKRACNCNVIITSATGGEHESGLCSHANGYKVDLRNQREGASLTNYITRNYQRLPNRNDGAQVYISPTGATYALESNHWDVAKC